MFDQRGELPLLPFGYPIGFVPASRGGLNLKSKVDSRKNLVRECLCLAGDILRLLEGARMDITNPKHAFVFVLVAGVFFYLASVL